VPTSWGRCVVTIGIFDGMHRGHADIIARAVTAAHRRDLPSVLLTFVPHPSELVRPGSHPPILTTVARRAELAAQLGIDVFCVLPFTLEFSHLDPAEFVHQAMVERLHAAEVVVGENFRFGHKATGDFAALTELGKRFGFAAQGIELLRDGETVISATYVRSCVEAGDMELAQAALGRPHRLDGVIEHGDHRGRELGFPTANFGLDRYAAVPADGVYAGRVVRLDEHGQTTKEDPVGLSAISIGTNPTFDGQQRRVEAHILDFDGDLYGHRLGVEFNHRLRETVRFDGVAALIEQMNADVARTRVVMAE
jgi:riboflavin kinase/FMN adenylyltransferase